MVWSTTPVSTVIDSRCALALPEFFYGYRIPVPVGG